MKRSIRVAYFLAFAGACLFTSRADAQFGFGFGGGSGHNSGGGINFGFGSGGGGHSEGHHHGESHGPRIGINFGIPSIQPNWNRPQGNRIPQRVQPSNPPVVRQPAPKPPPKPVANAKPAATDPNDNPIQLVARHITAEEIRRAQAFFEARLKDYLGTLQGQLPAVDFDLDALIAVLVSKDIAADIQISLLDALRGGDLSGAREIWIGVFPGDPAPFGMPPARARFADFYVKFEGGGCTMADVVQLEGDLMEMGIAEEPCCGAESLLDDIRSHVQISQVVAQSTPGDASASVAAPAGEVSVVYLPSMPEGSIVVLDAGTVMLGTGGVGKMRMGRGNVAAALGYPQAVGQAAPQNNAKLVRSGILLENPTEDAVNYVIDSGSFSMQSGYQQTLPGEASKVISFDKGNGGKTAKYKLAPGSYRFVIKDRAWDLQKAAFAVDIDNSQNPEPFHCIVQGEHVAIPAGTVQTHKSSYPIVIRFDRGNGAQTKQVLHRQSRGNFQVAVNPADSLWDLFDPSASAQTVQSSRPDSDFTPAF